MAFFIFLALLQFCWWLWMVCLMLHTQWWDLRLGPLHSRPLSLYSSRQMTHYLLSLARCWCHTQQIPLLTSIVLPSQTSCCCTGSHRISLSSNFVISMPSMHFSLPHSHFCRFGLHDRSAHHICAQRQGQWLAVWRQQRMWSSTAAWGRWKWW